MNKMTRHIRDMLCGNRIVYTKYKNFSVQYSILMYPKALSYQVFLQKVFLQKVFSEKNLYHEWIGGGIKGCPWVGDTFYYT